MIAVLLAGVVVIAVIYIFFIGWCLVGFFKKNASVSNVNEYVAVIVAFRNEKNNLETLIHSLKQQSYPDFEIILVDDHSADLKGFIFPDGVTVVKNQGEGKKSALTTGCGHTTAPLLVFTDADCTHSPHWLQELVNELQFEKTGLVMGGVVPASMHSFFTFDDLSISASSVGAARAGMPFACSGASMACRRNDFLQWQPYHNNINQQSGDDVYLMQACLKNGFRVTALNTSQSLVYHHTATTLPHFFGQRMRWGQKTGTGQVNALFIGLLVWLYSLILYTCITLCFVNPWAAAICGIALIIGAIVNFLFLFLVSRHWKLSPSWALFVPAYVFHLGYIPWAALLGKIVPVRWKGRRVKSRN